MNTTASPFSALDQTELVQLALEASQRGDGAAALAYLKAAVQRPDATARAHLLLGAEYAQLQIYDRAAAEMEAALVLDPSFAIARFQLGLLQLSSGDGARASDTLTPLAELGPNHPLSLFGQGLIHLIRDEFAAALRMLSAGIAHNTDNLPLNADMQRMIDEINKLPPEQRDAADAPMAAPSEAIDHHMMLSAYTGNSKS